MRFPFRFSGILLTLLFASPLAADMTTCSPENSAAADLAWMEALTKALDESVAGPGATIPSAPPRPKPAPAAPAEADEAVPAPPTRPREPDVRAHARYDLAEPALTRLRLSTHVAAAKCRTRGSTRICGEQRSKYLCYRAVKEALADAGLVDGWWAEMAASDAHTRGSLAKRGFKNVLAEGYTSTTAPLGAVLVYSGGTKRCPGAGDRSRTCGHIELKLNPNEYCSDYCKSLPANAYMNRKLVGIYVKE